tara:strand:- start:8920 stop:9498 length:579 start_codon:yes stop_codon:yes gene_type:complete
MRINLCLGGLIFLFVGYVTVNAQTPQPFPGAGTSSESEQPAQAEASPPLQPVNPEVPANVVTEEARPIDPLTPTETELGFPLYPTAQYITSYDAGRNQRYYLFGTTAVFEDIVAYYRTVLRNRGRTIFDEPPTHWFQIGRFRESTMAFPPGVTVKDYTWAGSAGYPNATAGTTERFPTIIQIVPSPVVSETP